MKTPLILVLPICLVLFTVPALSFDKISVRKIEYDSLSYMCKRAGNMKLQRGIIQPQKTLSEKKLIWSVGGWHYCTGYVKLLRAELAPSTSATARLAKAAIGDMGYSVGKINKNEPWFAEMAVSLARAHRILGEPEEAIKYLTQAKEYHPSYPQTYVAMSALHFDTEDYPAAVEILEEGKTATNAKNAEIQYFLGLAYLHTGALDQAKKQQEIARRMGYPLRGLARKLAEHEQAPSEVAE